jgi:sulfur-oxidizing protein SoxY
MSRLPPLPEPVRHLPAEPTRRQALLRSTRLLAGVGAGVAGGVWLQPAQATEPTLQAALRSFTGGKPVQVGRVRLEVAPLVDNGNAVPLSVSVDSPMTPADHVVQIAVFNEHNPQREVITATLGPDAGVARLSTRVRLATSQQLVAVARMSDGSHWAQTVDVIVTLAACLET